MHRSGPQSESSLFDPVLTLSVNDPSQLPVHHLQHVVPVPRVTSAKVFPVKQFLGQLEVVDEEQILRAKKDKVKLPFTVSLKRKDARRESTGASDLIPDLEC